MTTEAKQNFVPKNDSAEYCRARRREMTLALSGSAGHRSEMPANGSKSDGTTLHGQWIVENGAFFVRMKVLQRQEQGRVGTFCSKCVLWLCFWCWLKLAFQGFNVEVKEDSKDEDKMDKMDKIYVIFV